MKNLLLFTFLSICLLASCGGDDPLCVKADYLGTWVGTEECDLLDSTQVTITIVELGQNLEINGGEFETDEVNFSECSISGDNTFLGIGFKYSGSLSENGTSLSLQHKNVGTAIERTCNYRLTKQ